LRSWSRLFFTAADFFSDDDHFDVDLIPYFLQCKQNTKNLGRALYNSDMKWAWNDSHAFVVLNDDAEHFDQTDEAKWSLQQYKFLEVVAKPFHSLVVRNIE
jgi:hypothetical protein